MENALIKKTYYTWLRSWEFSRLKLFIYIRCLIMHHFEEKNGFSYCGVYLLNDCLLSNATKLQLISLVKNNHRTIITIILKIWNEIINLYHFQYICHGLQAGLPEKSDPYTKCYIYIVFSFHVSFIYLPSSRQRIPHFLSVTETFRCKEIESPCDSCPPSIQTIWMSRNKEHDLD